MEADSFDSSDDEADMLREKMMGSRDQHTADSSDAKARKPVAGNAPRAAPSNIPTDETKPRKRKTRVMSIEEVSPGGSFKKQIVSPGATEYVPTKGELRPVLPFSQVGMSRPRLSRVMSFEVATPIIKTEDEAENQLLSEVAQDIAHSNSSAPVEEQEDTRNPETCFAEGTKRLPKFVANTSKLIFTNEWVQETVSKLKAKAGPAVPVSPEFPLLEVIVNDIPGDPYSVSLNARGLKDLVQKVKKEVFAKIDKEQASYNLPALLKDGSSVELDLRLDCSGADSKIGAYCENPKETAHQPGVWIVKLPEDSQLQAVVGNATDRGAAIISVDGSNVHKLADITEAWKRAKEKGKDTAVVVVCLSKEADLSKVDVSRLHNMSKPRRRDGAVYRGRYIFSASTTPRRASNTKPASKIAGDERVLHKKQPPATIAGDEGVLNKKRKSDVVNQTDASVKKRNIDVVDQADAAATRKKFSSDVARKHLAAYQHLVEKYHMVREIEYKAFGINGQSVNKAMWDRHKVIYGEDCNEQCLCPSDLARLTETIVPEFIEKMKKKDREWENPQGLCAGESPVGFISNFVPKYYDKVRKEFPQDTPAHTLKKLLKMWTKHKEQRRFGIRCRKTCPCSEGWETVFKKIFCPKTPDTKSGSAVPATLKRSLSDSRTLTKPAVASKSDGGSKEKTGSLLRKLTSPLQQQVQKKDFAVIFNALEPLGFYCISEQKKEKGSVFVQCKIFSVSPFVERKHDNRLKVGTVVLGSAPWSISQPKEAMVPLRTHIELKTRYEAIRMKKDNSKLKLWFTNSDISVPLVAVPLVAVKRKNEWTSSGAWQGQSDKGWPGGAPIAQKVAAGSPQDQNCPSDRLKNLVPAVQDNLRNIQSGQLGAAQPSQSTCSSERSSGQPPSLRNSGAGQQSSLAKLSDVKSEDDSAKRSLLAKQILSQKEKSPTHEMPDAAPKADSDDTTEQGKKLPGPSLLRSRSAGEKKAGKAKRVSFRRQISDVREYIKDSELVDQGGADDSSAARDGGAPSDDSKSCPLSAPKAATVDMDIPIQQRRSDEMTKAILEKDYKEVIHLLKSGAYAQQKDSKKKVPRQYTKENLEKISHQLKTAHGDFRDKLKADHREFHLKDTVLKIYLQAEHLINMARYLKEWINVELTPLRAKDLRLTERGKCHPASDFIFSVVHLDGRIQDPSMPLIPFSESPDWTQVQNCSKYTLGLNKEMEFSYKMGRKVKVDLIKGSSNESSSNIKLGTWEDMVENIKDALTSSGEAEVDHELKRSEFLLGGSMDVKFRTVPPDSDFFRRKRMEIARGLSDLSDWIHTFQKETSVDVLDANISLPVVGGLSILHAAVYVADLNLVYRLLSLGADSSTSSTEAGSAENLAVNLADKSTTAGSTETHGTLIDIMNALKRDAASSRQKNDVSPGNQDSVSQHTTGVSATPSTVSAQNASQDKPHSLRDPRELNQLANKVRSILKEREQQAQPVQQVQPMQQASAHPPWTSAGYQAPLPPPPLPPPHAGYHQQPGPPMQQQTGPPQQYGYATPAQHYGHSAPLQFQGYPGQHHPTAVAPGQVLMPHAAQTGQSYMPTPNTNQLERLPKLNPVDWINGKSVRCTYFNKVGGCRYGKNCINAHVHPPIGVELDDGRWSNNHSVMEYSGKLWSAKNIHVKAIVNPIGKKWFTAAYFDPETNVIYYAERGTSALLSEQGVYWYPNESDAIVATKRVVLHALQSAAASGFNGQLALQPPPQPLPSQTLGNIAGDNTNEFADVFNKLRQGADMQAIYTKIFPKNTLPKSVWKSERSPVATFTTVFCSPAKEENGAMYVSIGCGGTYTGGKWWYAEEKLAKCSAFLQFLINAAQRGLVKLDLTGTSDGKRFFK